MKRLILLFLLSISCLGAFAADSPVLTAVQNNYNALDSLVKQQIAFLEPGDPGQDNKVWDFRKIQTVNKAYTLKYYLPDSTDMTGICGLEHDTHYYYRQQKDSLQATGYENSTTSMTYTQPELRMHFPFAYGDTLYSTFEGTGEYGHLLPLYVKGYTRVHADAEGILLLPGQETINKTLRVHTLRHYTEIGVDSVEMILDTYSWYATGSRYPVFESVRITIQKGANESTMFSTSFYYSPKKQPEQPQAAAVLPNDSINTSPMAASVMTEIQLFPNPVINE